MTEAAKPRCVSDAKLTVLEAQGATNTSKRNWRKLFLDKLAETSNVTASAGEAGISPSRAYKLRRRDANFAVAWRSALLEGYEHLELETLYRLRRGTGKDDPKFDIANALRLLTMHRDIVSNERQPGDRDESSIFASIDAKIETMQAREENVTRLLRQEGVRTPKLPERND